LGRVIIAGIAGSQRRIAELQNCRMEELGDCGIQAIEAIAGLAELEDGRSRNDCRPFEA
jgi:hypothetical protein